MLSKVYASMWIIAMLYAKIFHSYILFVYYIVLQDNSIDVEHFEKRRHRGNLHRTRLSSGPLVN